MPKCCIDKNICGANVIETLEQLNKIKSKAGRDGYYWTPGKTLVINFGNRDIAPQPNFKVMNMQEIAQLRMTPVNSWKRDCELPPDFKLPVGSWDIPFEQANINLAIAKKVQTYIDLVLEYANINIIYINGLGFDQVEDPYNINQDVEGVIDVYFNNYENDGKLGSANIGKYFIPTVLKPSNRVFNLNNFNSTIHYFEEKDSDEPGEPPQIVDIVLNLKIPNTMIYQEFENAINSKISSLFQASGKQFYNTLKFKFIKDETYPYNIRYKCKFLIEGEGEGAPEKVYIKIPNNDGNWKTFGINKNETLIFSNKETEPRYFDIIYTSDLKFFKLFGKNIMHEFMHILGFMHDQNIGSVINPYKNDAVWKVRPVYFLTFDNITSPNVTFDFDSIMLYPINCCGNIRTDIYMNDTTLINTRENMKMSTSNKKNICSIYPGKQKCLLLVENYHYKRKSNILIFIVILLVFIIIFLFIL